MKKIFCVLALSACVFACHKQQAKDEGRAESEREAELSKREQALIESKQKASSRVMPVSVEQESTNGQQPAEEIENKPTPANMATTPSPVESITPQPEASATPTVTETPILSPTETPTPAISAMPEVTVQSPETAEKPVLTSTPRLRLNPLSTGTPFPQATVSAAFSSSPVASPVPSETRSQGQKPATSTPTTSSWIRNASGKKRAKPPVSPSPSP